MAHWQTGKKENKKEKINICIVVTVDYLIMHSFFEHLFPLYGWPRTLHQKIVTYSCRLPSLIVEYQKWMYSLEWHTLGMLHKNMHYEIVNCTRILSGLRIQALLHTLKVVHTVH